MKQSERFKKSALVLAMVAMVVALLGCDSGSEEAATAEAPEASAEGAGADEAPAQGEAPGQGGSAAPSVEYPGVDLSKLGAAERARLTEMAEGELCPCPDSTESLNECMQKEERCEEAETAFTTMVTALAEGAGEEAQQRVAEQQNNEDRVHNFVLEGVPVKGSAEADVKIVEFADFQCGYCRMAAGVLSAVHEQLGDDVGIYFKQFPLGSPLSDLAARATNAAHKQDRFWQMHDLIFANQQQFNPQRLEAYARQLGLNYERFQEDLKSQEIGALVARDRQEGMAAGVQGTPSLFINGKRYTGQLTPEAIVAAVKAEAAAAE